MGSGGSTPAPIEYSFIVPGSAEEGSTPVHRAAKSRDRLVETLYDDVRTLYDNFQRGVRVSGDRPFIGLRPVGADGRVGDYVWSTYNEVSQRVTNFGSGLLAKNLLEPNADGLRIIGHYLKNSPEWVMSQLASMSYGGIVCPLYDTLGPDAVQFILNQTETRTVLCSPLEVPKLLASKPMIASLTTIVQTGEVTAKSRADCAAAGVAIFSFEEIEAAGRAAPQPHRPPRPEDFCTFCYTSGTTGDPKGAMLTHRNLIADIAGAVLLDLAIYNTDVHLSYLPLAHVFELIVQVALIGAGASIGFYQGDTLKLMEDIKALRPTIFPSVPRLYNRIYDRITQGVQQAGGVKAKLFNSALESKRYWLQRGFLTHRVWDALVFNKLKARLGLDRVRLMVTGSAPIAPHVMEFLRCVFACSVQEGYGQTECSASATLTLSTDYSVGHVGGPMLCNEVKLVDVAEMDYRATDTRHGADGANPGVPCCGRGEVCFRGANVFAGYYKQPDKTAEAIDSAGWLHSGDIGIWLPNGALRIVDRKKNIFKLSQGEYVAAEKIENVLKRSPFVGQIFVYGDSLQAVLVAVIVPEADYVTKTWAPASGAAGQSLEDLCKAKALKDAMRADLDRVAKEGDLRGFEKIADFHLDHVMWTVENNILTPTFKLKRNEAKKRYQREIDAMYASGIGVVAGKTGLKQGQ